jgi:hypothetical protein
MSVLKKKTAHIPLVGGRNDRLDPKTLGIAPWLAQAQNVYRTRTGEWAPRHGFTLLNNTVLDSAGTTMDTIRKLANRDGELVAMCGQRFFSYNPTRLGWTDLSRNDPGFVGSVDQTIVTHSITEPPFDPRNFEKVGNVDSAYGNGFVCTVWETTVGFTGVYYSITEEASGVPIRRATGSGIAGRRPKVTFSEGAFMIWAVEESGASSTLKVTKIPTSTMTQAATVNVTTDLLGTGTGTPWFDVQVRSSGNVVVAYRGTGPNVRALEWDPTTNAASIAAVTVVGTDVAANGLAFITQTAVINSITLCTAVNSATGVVDRFLSTTTLAQTATSTLKTSPGDVAAITGWDNNSKQYVLWEVRHASDARQHRIDYGSDTGVVTSGTFMASGVLAGKAFQVGSGNDVYVPVSMPYERQPGYYLVTASRLVNGLFPSTIARWLRGNGTAVPLSRNALGNPTAVTATKFIIPALRLYSIHTIQASGSFDFRNLPVYVTMDFAGVPPPPVGYGKSVIFPGSMPRIYCGRGVEEMGFNVDPEKPTLALDGVFSGPDNGDSQVCIVMLYQEGGMEWRSAPSDVAKITITGNAAVDVTVYVPPVVQGRQNNLPGSVLYEIYRTKANGTVFYRSKVLSNGGAPTFTVVDGTTDAQLELQLQLYSQVNDAGTPLVYQPPPPSRAMAIQGNRVLAIDAENPTDVWGSLELQPGRGWAFHPDMRVRIEADGPAFALAVLDGQAIVFKRNAIYKITGDWPNANGQGSLPLAAKVAEGFGCIQPETVCVTSDGVWFKDPKKGRCFLDRALTVSQPGKAVQAADANTDVAATLVEDFEQVRFLTGGALVDFPVYDYLEKQWSSWLISGGGGDARTAAVVAAGVYYIGRTDGRVLFYDTTRWTDAGGTYNVSMTTRLALGGIEGIQRLYRVTLMGALQIGSERVRLTARLFDDHSGNLLSERKDALAPPSAADTTGAFAVGLRPKNGRTTHLLLNWFFNPGALTVLNEGLRFSAIAAEVGVTPGKLRRLPKGNQK